MVVCYQLNSSLLAAVGADLPCLRICIHPRKGNKWRRRRGIFSHETITAERRHDESAHTSGGLCVAEL